MATAARKARKRAGIKFENYTQARSEKKRQRFLDRFTPAPSE